MIIEGEDFKLTSISDTSLRFDLDLLYTVRPKDGEERNEFKNAAYGVSLEYAIKVIAHYRVAKNHKDKAIELATYYKEFIDEFRALKVICDN